MQQFSRSELIVTFDDSPLRTVLAAAKEHCNQMDASTGKRRLYDAILLVEGNHHRCTAADTKCWWPS